MDKGDRGMHMHDSDSGDVGPLGGTLGSMWVGNREPVGMRSGPYLMVN